MTENKKYYAISFTVIILEILISFFIDISLEAHCAFLVTYIFPLFLRHPDIEEYKANPRRRLAFVSVLFSFQNLLERRIANEFKYKDIVVRQLPGIIFLLIVMLISPEISKLIGGILGALAFELVFYIYSKQSNLSGYEDDL